MSTRLIAAERNYTYQTTAAIYVFTCADCGLLFGIDNAYDERRRKDGRSFYCPNGHILSYRETEEDRLRKRAEAAERRASDARESEQFHRDLAAAERRSATAYKGHLTRAKNRIAQGVCPVPGCKRSGFERVAQHIAAVHPEWAHEHPEVMSGE